MWENTVVIHKFGRLDHVLTWFSLRYSLLWGPRSRTITPWMGFLFWCLHRPGTANRRLQKALRHLTLREQTLPNSRTSRSRRHIFWTPPWYAWTHYQILQTMIYDLNKLNSTSLHFITSHTEHTPLHCILVWYKTRFRVFSTHIRVFSTIITFLKH